MYGVHFKHKNDDKSRKGKEEVREDTQRKGWNRG